MTTPPKNDATRVACAALAGFQLRRLADGAWLLSRWNLTREFTSDEELEAFLRSAGVPV